MRYRVYVESLLDFWDRIQGEGRQEEWKNIKISSNAWRALETRFRSHAKLRFSVVVSRDARVLGGRWCRDIKISSTTKLLNPLLAANTNDSWIRSASETSSRSRGENFHKGERIGIRKFQWRLDSNLAIPFPIIFRGISRRKSTRCSTWLRKEGNPNWIPLDWFLLPPSSVGIRLDSSPRFLASDKPPTTIWMITSTRMIEESLRRIFEPLD